MRRLDNGVRISECCASCRHKADNWPFRRCSIKRTDVMPDHCCDRWEAMPRFLAMKLGGGYVKTVDYLRFAGAIAVDNEQRPIDKRVSVLEMRRKYRRMTGKEIILM